MLLLRQLNSRNFSSLPRAKHLSSPRILHLAPRSAPHALQRHYVQAPSPPDRKPPQAPSSSSSSSASPSKNASPNQGTYEIAETLLIYHAGTGRITFLAMLKVTSLFVGAFFCLLVGPSYIKADKSPSEIAGVLSCGLIPLLFTAYTTAPFVTHIHIHLPPAARSSPLALRAFIASALPPSTELSITTMSPIAKPRYSRLRAGDLRPARQRFGIVNYLRAADAADAREGRKWYNLGAVNGFCVSPQRHGAGAGAGAGSLGTDGGGENGRASAKRGRDRTEAWIWEALRDRIARREAAAAAAANRLG